MNYKAMCGSIFTRWTSLLISVITLTVLSVSLLSSGVTKANDLPIVHISGALESSQVWSPSSVYVIDSTVTVPDGVTLTIEPGAIVKVSAYSGIQIFEGGTLYAVGTSTSPITITSIKDDSVGGDTNGDGTVSSAVPGDYAYAVTSVAGMVTEQYVTTKYAGMSFSLACHGGYVPGAMITDNQFYGSVEIDNCSGENIAFKRNHLQADLYAALSLTSTDVSLVTMSGADKNTFAGSDRQGVFKIFNSRLASGRAWSVDSTNNVVLEVSDFSVYGTVNFGPGLVVKHNVGKHGVLVKDGGSLYVDGNASSAVTFTSMEDDSIGGARVVMV